MFAGILLAFVGMKRAHDLQRMERRKRKKRKGREGMMLEEYNRNEDDSLERERDRQRGEKKEITSGIEEEE